MIMNESNFLLNNSTTIPEFSNFIAYTILAVGVVIVGLFGLLIYWGQGGGGGGGD